MAENSNMMFMQKNAVRRVQEIERRSRELLNNSNQRNTKRDQSTNNRTNSSTGVGETGAPAAPGSTAAREGKGHSVAREKKEYERIRQEGTDNSFIEKILKDLNIDGDRIMLLGLIIVLMNEGANETMLLALLYILL